MPHNTIHHLQDEEICARCSRENGGCCVADPDNVSNCFPLSPPEVMRLLPYAHLAEATSPALPLPEAMLAVLEARCETPAHPESPPEKPMDVQSEPGRERNDAERRTPVKHRSGGELLAGACRVVTAERTTAEFISIMQAVLPEHAKRMAALFPEGGRHFRLRTLEDGACALLGPTGCSIPREARPWYCQSYPGWLCRGELTLLMDDCCLVAQEARTPMQGVAKLGMTVGDIRFFHREMLKDWDIC